MNYIKSRLNEISTIIGLIIAVLVGADIVTTVQVENFFEIALDYKVKTGAALLAVMAIATPDSKITEVINKLIGTNLSVAVVSAISIAACAFIPDKVYAEIYNDVEVEISHDPVSYTIDRYALYENCPSSDVSGRVLVNGNVSNGSVISLDIPLVAQLAFCVSAIVKDANNQDIVGEPFAFHEFSWTDIPAPQNGVLNINVTCKNPACTSVQVNN